MFVAHLKSFIMAYKVVDKKGRIVFGGESFSSKSAAEQAIVDAIKGASANKDSLKYYKEFAVRKK